METSADTYMCAHTCTSPHMLHFAGGWLEIMSALAPPTPVYCLVFEVISVNTKDIYLLPH